MIGQIITRGYGSNSVIVTRGYGGGSIVVPFVPRAPMTELMADDDLTQLDADESTLFEIISS